MRELHHDRLRRVDNCPVSELSFSVPTPTGHATVENAGMVRSRNNGLGANQRPPIQRKGSWLAARSHSGTGKTHRRLRAEAEHLPVGT
jgi:hypothetical protein